MIRYCGHIYTTQYVYDELSDLEKRLIELNADKVPYASESVICKRSSPFRSVFFWISVRDIRKKKRCIPDDCAISSKTAVYWDLMALVKKSVGLVNDSWFDVIWSPFYSFRFCSTWFTTCVCIIFPNYAINCKIQETGTRKIPLWKQQTWREKKQQKTIEISNHSVSTVTIFRGMQVNLSIL